MIILPDKNDLLSFFEKEPIEIENQKGVSFYRITDKQGVELEFSFDELCESIQIIIKINEKNIALFSQEGVKKISIEKNKSDTYLYCYFKIDGLDSCAFIRIKPYISIKFKNILN